MHTNELFLANLKSMNTVVRSEIKAGKRWRYKNSGQEHTFEQARKKNNRVTNCVLGVRWGLRGLVPDGALNWYGAKGKIQWGNATAEERAKKYFDIIHVGTKTVKQLYRQGKLCPGDILTYSSMVHTNAYIGNGRSFDTGHAYCIGQRFRKWIGALSCKGYNVEYILRLKDRAHYRVQAGAYYETEALNAQLARLKALGYSYVLREEAGMTKVQVGYFDNEENAEALVKALKKKKVAAFIIEE